MEPEKSIAEQIAQLRQLSSKAPEVLPGVLAVLDRLAADVEAIKAEHQLLFGG